MNLVCAQPAGVCGRLITGCYHRSGGAALCGPLGANRFLGIVDISAGMLKENSKPLKNAFRLGIKAWA